MRIDFEMTQEQLNRLLDACRPQPYLIAGGIAPMSPQENANRAWASLGDELLFDWRSVQPSGRGDRFFTAEPKAGYDVRPDEPDNGVWFASGPGFANLQESPAGFGATPQSALTELRRAMDVEVRR